jgi:hypothetical protein
MKLNKQDYVYKGEIQTKDKNKKKRINYNIDTHYNIR